MSVPDLLRRFSPTPHCARVHIAGCGAVLRTNDLDLRAAMQAEGGAARDLAITSLSITVIRDFDAPSAGTQSTLLEAFPLVTLLVGTGTTLTLDLERREIIGFVAPNVATEHFAEELLPILVEYVSRSERTPQQQDGKA